MLGSVRRTPQEISAYSMSEHEEDTGCYIWGFKNWFCSGEEIEPVEA
jgi:hypothetical protein